MTLHLPLGKKLVVKAKNVKEPYIGRMYYNGTVYNHNYLNHDELLKGGTIIYEMQAAPERQRGSKSVDAPYSFSKE
jgi:putative alpha-1,2-mannosidase